MPKDLVERVAEVIYLHDGGMTPDEYETAIGSKRKAWKTDASWDSQPEVKLCEWKAWKTDAAWDSQPEVELCEWQRDEYCVQARAVVALLERRMNNDRLVELLQRLVAPGPKAAHVSASECHEIVDDVMALVAQLAQAVANGHAMARAADSEKADRVEFRRLWEEAKQMHTDMRAEVKRLKELLDDDAFRKMREDRDQLLAKVERLREQ